MKKFLFRLETLLKERKAREGRMQRELAYIRQKWTQLKEEKGSIEIQISALLEEIRIKREQKEHGLEETYSQLLDHLNTSLAQVEEAFELQKKQVEEKRQQLKRMIQERKVVEKIKEKHYTQWRVQVEQSEGSLLDENTLKQPHPK
jgi:flagellar FliJ protein